MADQILFISPEVNNTLNKADGQGEEYSLENGSIKLIAPALEDYCIAVDINVNVFTSGAKSSKHSDNEVINVSSDGIKTRVSFMKGTELNGRNSLSTAPYEVTTYADIASNKPALVNNEMLGINSIDIEYNSFVVPQITIEFTDIRGLSLIAAEQMRHTKYQGSIRDTVDDNVAGSFFKTFFSLPRSRYTMMVKGFYGEPATYEMCYSDFRARFDSRSGNFIATVKFVGYLYSILGDISINSITSAPYDEYYGATYWAEQVANGTFTVGGTQMPTLANIVENWAKIGAAVKRGLSSQETLNKIGVLLEKKTHLEYLCNALDNIIAAYDSILKNYASDSKCKAEGKKFYLKKPISSEVTNASELLNKISEYTAYEVPTSVQIFKPNLPVSSSNYLSGTSIDEEGECKYLIDFSDCYEKLQTEYNEVSSSLNAENKTANDENTEASKVLFEDTYGFSPTVSNLTKIIIAHFDTLLHCIYHCQDEVIANNAGRSPRTISNMNIGTTDQYNISENSGLIDAFPKVTKTTTNADGETIEEETWLGDEAVGANANLCPEINLVNGLLQGTNSVANAVAEAEQIMASSDYSSNGGQNEGYSTTASTELKSKVLIPTTPLDFIDGIPDRYENINGETSDIKYILKVATLMAFETMGVMGKVGEHDGKKYSFQEQDIARVFGIAEARNFANKFPNPQGDIRVKLAEHKDAWTKSGDDYFFKIINDTNFLSREVSPGYALYDLKAFEVTDKNVKFTQIPIGNGFKKKATNFCLDSRDFKYGITSNFVFSKDEKYKSFMSLYEGINLSDAAGNSMNGGEADISKIVNRMGMVYTQENFASFFSDESDIQVKFDNGGDEDKIVTLEEFFRDESFKNNIGKCQLYNTDTKRDFNDEFKTILGNSNRVKNELGADLFNLFCLMYLCGFGDVDNYYPWYKKSGFLGIGEDSSDDERGGIKYMPYSSILIIGGLLKCFHNGQYKDKKYQSFVKLCQQHERAEDFVTDKEKLSEIIKNPFSDKFVINTYFSKSGRRRLIYIYDQWVNNGLDDLFTYDDKGTITSINASSILALLGTPYYVIKSTSFSVTTERRYLLESSTYMHYMSAFIDELASLYKTSSSTDSSSGTDGSYGDEAVNAPTVDVTASDIPEIKIGLYKFLKLIFDTWLSGNNENTWGFTKLWERFHFIDAFYNSANDFVVNIEEFVKTIIECQSQRGYSVISFLSNAYAKSQFTLQVVHNFIDLKQGNEISMRRMQNLFKPIPYNEMSYDLEALPDFVMMYSYEPSSSLGINDYEDDGFDLDEANEALLPKAITNKNASSSKIPAFGVSYGEQYQSYFKNIEVGMENPVVTEQVIQAQYQIGAMCAHIKANDGNDSSNGEQHTSVGQDLFTIYSNNSYSCTVTMMGNATIQPLMYFQLMNVPLFHGAYIINKVTHHISQGEMETRFTGTRVCKTQSPKGKTSFVSLNQTYNYAEGGNGYYDPTVNATLENDCKCMTYPLAIGCGKKVYSMDDLNKPFSACTNKLEASNYNNDHELVNLLKGSSLIDAIAATICGEADASNTANGRTGTDRRGNSVVVPLGRDLVATVIFNRFIKNGIGDTICFKESFNSLGDGNENVKRYLKNKESNDNDIRSSYAAALGIFTQSPLIISGKTSVPIPYNEKNPGKVFTLSVDMLQRLFYFQGTAWQAENDTWQERKTEQIGTDGKHWFGLVKEKLWKEEDFAETECKTTKTEVLLDSIKRTCDHSKTALGFGGDSIKTLGDDGNRMKLDAGKENNSKLFDIILNGYYNDFSGLYWENKNDSSEKPDTIIVYCVTDNKAGKSVSVVQPNAEGKPQTTLSYDKLHSDFYTSLRKKYWNSDSTFANEPLFKKECKNFSGSNYDKDKVHELLNKDLEPCTTSSTGPVPNYNGGGSLTNGRIGDWNVAASIAWAINNTYDDYKQQCAAKVEEAIKQGGLPRMNTNEKGLRKGKDAMVADNLHRDGILASHGFDLIGAFVLEKRADVTKMGNNYYISGDKISDEAYANSPTSILLQPGDVVILSNMSPRRYHAEWWVGTSFYSDTNQHKWYGNRANCYNVKLNAFVYRYSGTQTPRTNKLKS